MKYLELIKENWLQALMGETRYVTRDGVYSAKFNLIRRWTINLKTKKKLMLALNEVLAKKYTVEELFLK